MLNIHQLRLTNLGKAILKKHKEELMTVLKQVYPDKADFISFLE